MRRFDSKWINRFPRNSTQTRYRRGMKTVYEDLDSDFSKGARRFKNKWKNPFERVEDWND